MLDLGLVETTEGVALSVYFIPQSVRSGHCEDIRSRGQARSFLATKATFMNIIFIVHLDDPAVTRMVLFLPNHCRLSLTGSSR